MRTQEFRFQTSPFSRSTRFPFTSTASPPAPLAIRKTPNGRRRKSRRQSHKFFKHLLRLWHPNSLPGPGEAPHPAPSARQSATRTAQKTALCAPCEHPGGSESENRPATRGTAHSEVQGDARCTARCTTRCTTRCTARCSARPMAALHFLLPTGHSRSGRRSLIPNISLLPLDEVPVHVHRFAARAPCDSKDSEWAAKEKRWEER